MRRIVCLLGTLVLAAVCVSPVFAASDEVPVPIPPDIQNNKYYLESVRFHTMAEKAYDEGAYDDSAKYAGEALRYAKLSDDYVALQLRIKAANDAISAAQKRIAYADSIKAAQRYPKEYGDAKTFYGSAIDERKGEKYEEAVVQANAAVAALANIAPENAAAGKSAPEKRTLPSQYTVRTWPSEKDCLWNIAGRPWAYNDPWKWKLIYDANKSIMPEKGNPNLIEPGMVLTLPSLKGEERSGMWDPAKDYGSLR